MAERPSSTSDRARDAMEQLRSLLLEPQQHELADIKARLDDRELTAEEVAELLVEAIRLRAAHGDDLGRALVHPVEAAITRSARADPAPLSEALYPIMGPAIRRAISVALSGMVQTLNQLIEHSVSVNGMRLRLEAFRTGKPFAEVLLLHSLRYRVEQVLLVHRDSGLLLAHATTEAEQERDADVISGMLTAIQDFARDSFGTNEGDDLGVMQLGDLTVRVAHGPHAYLAAVVRGDAPAELGAVLDATLEEVHRRLGEPLAVFDGDDSPFDAVRPQLDECLLAEYQPTSSRPSPLLLVFVALLVGVFGYWMWGRHVDERRFTEVVDRLRAAPGIVVTEVGKRGGHRFIDGLHDPLAPEPHELGVADDIALRFEPYHALDPTLVLLRAKRVLEPPPGVQLELRGEQLIASGHTGHRWIATASARAPALSGVVRLTTDDLVDDDLVAFEGARAAIDATEIHFVSGTALLDADALEPLRAALERLTSLAVTLDRSLAVAVTGHVSDEGAADTNRRLSAERASQVIDGLVAAGIDPALLHAAPVPDDGSRRGRLATLTVLPAAGARSW